MTTAHETRKYNKNGVVCLQGEQADGLFVLRKGRVGILIHPDVAVPSEEQVLADGVQVGTLEQEGMFIGEGGFFLDHRGASVVALTDGTTVERVPLAASGLQQIMTEQPRIAMKLCRSLAEHLRDVTERVKEVSTLAECVSRGSDQMAVAYSDLLRSVEKQALSEPDLNDVLSATKESPLSVRGRALVEQRRETTVFFTQAAKQQRSGTMSLKKDEVLCEEGSIGRALYLVREGELEVRSGSVPVGRIGAGEIVGEIAVLLKEFPKRSATVRASEPTMLNCISAAKLHAMVEEKPAILVPIARTLANRLDTTNRLLCQRSRSSVDVLNVLAGAEQSCEAYFLHLAECLDSFESCPALAAKARSLAKKAARTRADLETTYCEVLEPLRKEASDQGEAGVGEEAAPQV